jgi:amino acid transporter
MKIGRFSTITLVLVSLFSLGALLLILFATRQSLFGVGSLADLFGFLALGLIAATGVLMLFKNSLTARMGSPERLWRLHIVIAGAGGFFLGLHAVLFFALPLSLPVLLGYAATGAALFIWVTGGIYFQGARNSMFYHGLLSIGAIFFDGRAHLRGWQKHPCRALRPQPRLDSGRSAGRRHLAAREGLEV